MRSIKTVVALCLTLLCACQSKLADDSNARFSSAIQFRHLEQAPAPGLQMVETADAQSRYYMRPDIILSGNEIADSVETFDAASGMPMLGITLTPSGTQNMARFSQAHVGAIVGAVKNNRLLFNARLATPIAGGKLQVNFPTLEEARRANRELREP